jgi:hypothetical protein
MKEVNVKTVQFVLKCQKCATTYRRKNDQGVRYLHNDRWGVVVPPTVNVDLVSGYIVERRTLSVDESTS